MYYILDISTLDKYSSGAKQRFLSIYSNLVKSDFKKKFLIIYTTYDDVKKKFNFPNVKFLKNPISQEHYFKKLISIIYLHFFIIFKIKKIKSIEYFTLPFFKIKKCKTIFTIHDLRKIHFANFFINKLLLKLFFKFFLIKANKIIVVSKSIKLELTKYFENLNITVLYNTIDKNFFKKISNKEIIKIKKKYHIPNKFILAVGHLEKRKNYLNLIKAIKIIKNEDRNIKLIIIGQKADHTDKIFELIEKLNLKNNIKIFSSLNDYEVRCFYKISELFVFPSIYEGFGIPILEAMALNKPMVLSNLDVFREITENNSCYFDPNDPLSIANKIKFVLLNKDLQKKMVTYGKKRILKFTTDKQGTIINKFYNNFTNLS